MKVSIISPVYNTNDFIIDCLQSVASQSMTKGVEYILVDDCSTDDSAALVEQYITNYQGDIHFKFLRQSHNQGPSAARNAGIRIAQGNYIFFLDSDDKITPDCIELLYNLAMRHDADYAQGTYESNEAYHMPIYGNEVPEFTDEREYIKQTLLNYSIIPFTPHNRLIKRQLIFDHNLFFNEKITVREDFYWMFFLAKYVTRMAFCKQQTYYRGYNAESLTHHINQEREILAYKTLIEDFSSNIDSFLPGIQKSLLLDTLIMALRSEFYHSEDDKLFLIQCVDRCNTKLESFIYHVFIKYRDTKLGTKLLHALLRLYKNKG